MSVSQLLKYRYTSVLIFLLPPPTVCCNSLLNTLLPSAGEVTRAGMGSMIHIYSEGDKPRGNGMKYEDSRVITVPSSSNTLGQGMNKVDIPDLRAAKLETECKFNKKTKLSMRHECEARSYEVTSKKWKWIEKQKKLYLSSKGDVECRWQCQQLGRIAAHERGTGQSCVGW